MSELGEKLIAAVIAGDVINVKSLLEQGAPIEHVSHSATALYRATVCGHLACVRALVEAGADIDCIGYHGFTPICAAAHDGRLDIVEYLWDQGADPLIKNTAHQDTAYEAACRMTRTNVIAFLQDRNYKQEKRSPGEIVYMTATQHLSIKEIFNFDLLQRFTIIREKGHEGVSIERKSFAEVTDHVKLREAFNEHVNRGGTVPEHDVFKNGFKASLIKFPQKKST